VPSTRPIEGTGKYVKFHNRRGTASVMTLAAATKRLAHVKAMAEFSASVEKKRHAAIRRGEIRLVM